MRRRVTHPLRGRESRNRPAHLPEGISETRLWKHRRPPSGLVCFAWNGKATGKCVGVLPIQLGGSIFSERAAVKQNVSKTDRSGEGVLTRDGERMGWLPPPHATLNPFGQVTCANGRGLTRILHQQIHHGDTKDTERRRWVRFYCMSDPAECWASLERSGWP